MSDRLVREMSEKVQLCHVFTVPDSLLFIRGQTQYMQERGFDVHVITSPGDKLEKFGREEKVRTYAIDMPRKITPLKDLRALWHLVRTIHKIRPEIVHSHTPKGGLLGMIAATVTGVPIRVYHIRGLPYMTASGPKRNLMKTTEWVSCKLAHQVVCVSHLVREVAIQDGVCPQKKIKTFLGGSGNGVDAQGKFNPGRFDSKSRQTLRLKMGMGPDSLVIGFVGRIFREKGVEELAEAWSKLRLEFPNAHLVLVGEEQSENRISAETLAVLQSDSRVHFTGAVEDTAIMYSIFDVMVLPTYREGLPNVLLEAASMQLPVVSTRIPGCIEATVDGSTATLVPPQNSKDLINAIARYLSDAELRKDHGNEGRTRMLTEFKQEAIWEAMYEQYKQLMSSSSQP